MLTVRNASKIFIDSDVCLEFRFVPSLGFFFIPTNMRWITRCFSLSMYGVLSAVHVGFSAPLRSDSLAIWKNISGVIKWTMGSGFSKPSANNRIAVSN